jgi:predicted transcriptional regulator
VYTINTHGGCTGCHPKLIQEHITRLMSERDLDENGNSDDLKNVIVDSEHSSCDKYLACLFILVTNGGRYQGLKQALDNQYLMDKDAYPCTLPQALTLLE